jgi:MFS family permease
MVVRLLGSANFAGIGLGITGASRFLVAYPIGKITDTYGRKAGLVLGLAVALVGACVIALSMAISSFPIFLLGMIVFGMGVNAAQQVRVAAADMYPPSRRAEGLGLVLTGSLVGAIGTPALVALAQGLSTRVHVDPLALAWLFVPITIIPGILLVLKVHPDPKEIAANLEQYYPGYRAPASQPQQAVKVSFLQLLRHYPRAVAIVSTACVQGTMLMMMAMTSLVLHERGYGLSAITLSVAVHNMGMFGLSLPLGKLADHIGRRWVMIAGLALGGAGALLVPIGDGLVWTTVAIFLVGVGWSCVNVAATALIADTTSAGERGRAVGAADTLSAGSAIAFSFVAGPVAETMGFFTLGVLSAALVLPPLVMLARLREYSPGKYAVVAPRAVVQAS